MLKCCVIGALFRPLEANSTWKIATKIQHKDDDVESYKRHIFKRVALDFYEVKSQSLYDLNRNTKVGIGMYKAEDYDNPTGSRLLDYNSNGKAQMFGRQISQSHGQLNQKHHKNLLREIISKPLNRSDIFYSGSLYNIPEYQSNPNVKTFMSNDLINQYGTDQEQYREMSVNIEFQKDRC